MNELAVNEKNLLMTNQMQTYCSWNPQTVEEKKAFFNLINSPSKSVGDMVNKEIHLRHVYAETCEFINAETGEATPGIRMVLVDENGESYQTCSKGMYTSISKMLSILGDPAGWDAPVNILIKSIRKGANKNVLVFDLV